MISVMSVRVDEGPQTPSTNAPAIHSPRFVGANVPSADATCAVAMVIVGEMAKLRTSFSTPPPLTLFMLFVASMVVVALLAQTKPAGGRGSIAEVRMTSGRDRAMGARHAALAWVRAQRMRARIKSALKDAKSRGAGGNAVR